MAVEVTERDRGLPVSQTPEYVLELSPLTAGTREEDDLVQLLILFAPLPFSDTKNLDASETNPQG
jgi:hypothetical protein